MDIPEYQFRIRYEFPEEDHIGVDEKEALMRIEVVMVGDDEDWKGTDARLVVDLSETGNMMTVDGKSANDGKLALSLEDLFPNEPVETGVTIKTGTFAQLELDPKINLAETSSAEPRDYVLRAVVVCRLQVIDPERIPMTKFKTEPLVVSVSD